MNSMNGMQNGFMFLICFKVYFLFPFNLYSLRHLHHFLFISDQFSSDAFHLGVSYLVSLKRFCLFYLC